MRLKIFLLLTLFFTFVSQGDAREDKPDKDKGEFILETIVVTATKTEHTLADVPDSVVVISQEDLASQNVTNIQEALRWIPGLCSSSSYASMGGDEYLIDGAPSGYGLMLVDGNRMKGSYILSEIPVSTIERIEIVKGADSLLYGSDALSGVINIITKRAPDKFTFNLDGSYSFSEEDSNSEEASVGFKLGKLRQLYSYGRKDVQGGEFKSSSFAGKFGLDLTDNVELKLDLRSNEYDKENDDMKRNDYLVEMDWDVDDESSLIIKGFLRDYEGVSHVGGATIATEEDSIYNETEVSYTRRFGESHLVTTGVQRVGSSFDYAGPNETWSRDQNANSVYLQDEIMVFKSFVLVPAFRADFHSDWDNQFNPKVSMLWKVTDSASIRASWGKAFKAPSFQQMYRTTYHGHGSRGFWIIGNPELQPEKAETYRLGVEKRFGDFFQGSVTLFRNNLKDMIEGGYTGKMTSDNKPEYSYENVASAHTQDVETDFKLYLGENILATLGYTYLDTEDEETGKELEGTATHRITPGIRYQNRKIGFTAEVRGEYEKDLHEDDGTEGGNFLMHVNLSKSITERLTLWVSGDNLLDEEESSGTSIEGRKITCGMRFAF